MLFPFWVRRVEKVKSSNGCIFSLKIIPSLFENHLFGLFREEINEYFGKSIKKINYLAFLCPTFFFLTQIHQKS